MLQGLRKNPHLIRLFQEHIGHSSLIREMMDYLLTTEGLFHYWEELVNMLGVEILLHPADKTTPHLLTRVVEVCGKDYITSIFQKLEESSDLHLLCRAANENDIPLAKAYLQAHTDLQDRGIRRNSLTSDPDCIHSPTILEHIALSGNHDIMKLVLSQGANPRAVTADGRSLLDVATTTQMRKLLIQKGAQVTNPQDHLLMQCVIAIKTGDPHRLEYVAQLTAYSPVLYHKIGTETDALKSFWSVDLFSLATSLCDVETLRLLLPGIKHHIPGHHALDALEKAGLNCIRQRVTCGQFLDILHLFDANGLGGSHFRVQLPVLQIVQDLLFFQKQNEDIVDICYLLCKMFSLDPTKIYLTALTNVLRPDWGETGLSEEDVDAMFILRGWKPKRKRKNQQ